jgi:hypothetical protein
MNNLHYSRTELSRRISECIAPLGGTGNRAEICDTEYRWLQQTGFGGGGGQQQRGEFRDGTVQP